VRDASLEASTIELRHSFEVGVLSQNPKTKEGRLMPAWSLNQMFSLIIPTSGWPWWAVAVQGLLTAIGAELMSTSVALKWLTIGCVLDVSLSMIRSWRLPEKYPFSVLVPDVLVRAIALYLSWSLSKEAAFQFEYSGFSTNPGELLAIFFITIVWASAGKSSEKLGMRWPAGVMFLFNKIHSSLDDVELGDKAFSILTKFTHTTNGNTETTSKTETITETKTEE